MLLPGGLLNNTTLTSSGNPEKLYQSEDYFERAEVLYMHQMFSQLSVDMMYEAETIDLFCTLTMLQSLTFKTSKI